MSRKISSYFETSWAPVHKLNHSVGLEGCDGRVDILGHHVSSVQEADGHVLTLGGVALYHLQFRSMVN